MTQKITTFLWFDNNAQEAIDFYTSIFDDAKIVDTVRNGKAGPGEDDAVLAATFQLAGQQFMALNGGPHFKFTEAISLFVNCETQAEVDRYWDQLLVGGEPSQCGWLKDKFGLSWQIVPTALMKYMSDPDPVKAQRVMEAMMQMVKLDVDTLTKAYENEPA